VCCGCFFGRQLAAAYRAETKRLIREAIELHLDVMREVGEPIPEPISEVDFVELQPSN
jgi:predicted RNase H-like HicB family nuclease